MSKKEWFGAAVIFCFLVVTFLWNLIDQKQKEQAIKTLHETVDAKLAAAENPNNSQGQKNKMIIDTAFSEQGAFNIVNERYPEFTIRQRTLEHLTLGYQAEHPINTTLIAQLANIDCYSRAKSTEALGKKMTMKDIQDGWFLANDDLKKWLPYLISPNIAQANCERPFHVLVKKLETKKSISAKDLGASLGNAANKAGELWDKTTKPLTDTIQDFKEGFNAISN